MNVFLLSFSLSVALVFRFSFLFFISPADFVSFSTNPIQSNGLLCRVSVSFLLSALRRRTEFFFLLFSSFHPSPTYSPPTRSPTHIPSHPYPYPRCRRPPLRLAAPLLILILLFFLLLFSFSFCGLRLDFSLLFFFYFVLSCSMRIYLLACSSALLLTNSIQSNSSLSLSLQPTHSRRHAAIRPLPPSFQSQSQFPISHCLLSTIIHSLTHSLTLQLSQTSSVRSFTSPSLSLSFAFPLLVQAFNPFDPSVSNSFVSNASNASATSSPRSLRSLLCNSPSPL